MQLVTACVEDPVVAPVIPVRCTACLDLGSLSTLANLSVMNDVVDPGSNMALASTDLPSVDETIILHVMRRELALCSIAPVGLIDPVWLVVWLVVSCSKCRRVWCGF